MESLQQRVRWPRQLVRMQQAIHGEPDAIRADCLRAEHASLLARHGFQSQAEEALLELRKRYEHLPHPKVTAWINLADAIVEGRTGDPSGTPIKLRRAHAMAKACANAPMQALAAAWLAHWLWNAYDVVGAVGFAREALRTAAPNDHKARARASLVVAEIFALSARDAMRADLVRVGPSPCRHRRRRCLQDRAELQPERGPRHAAAPGAALVARVVRCALGRVAPSGVRERRRRARRFRRRALANGTGEAAVAARSRRRGAGSLSPSSPGRRKPRQSRVADLAGRRGVVPLPQRRNR